MQGDERCSSPSVGSSDGWDSSAVRSGVCFGWLPKDRIDADPRSGKLQVLRLTAGKERRIPREKAILAEDRSNDL
jgi:hypothetical protein